MILLDNHQLNGSILTMHLHIAVIIKITPGPSTLSTKTDEEQYIFIISLKWSRCSFVGSECWKKSNRVLKYLQKQNHKNEWN